MTETKRKFLSKLKRFIKECSRVLKVTKKPTNVEYKTIVKVSALGMLIIGFIGFLVQVIYLVFFR
jgi:protein transport protein SEC61 subunit gamma-like protein